ncbi:hypothetical protein Hdeb2414_s0009g00303891 [Helianthus debilis subsp. tardiflorus]
MMTTVVTLGSGQLQDSKQLGSQFGSWFGSISQATGQQVNGSVNHGQGQIWFGQRQSKQSMQDPEYYRCTLANSRSWNDTSESR